MSDVITCWINDLRVATEQLQYLRNARTTATQRIHDFAEPASQTFLVGAFLRMEMCNHVVVGQRPSKLDDERPLPSYN